MSYAGEPKAPKPDPSTAPQEPTGPVASDSLAAESNRAGGGFSENENIAQLGVKGASSTLANTDTSGATALHAASSGAEREIQDAKGMGSDERGTTGVKYPDAGALGTEEFGGTHTAEGYTGGPSGQSASSGTGADAVTSSYSGASGDSFADGGAGLGSGDSGYDPSKVSSGSSIPKTGAGASSGSSKSGATSGGATSSSGGPDSGASARPYVEAAPNYAATVSGAIRSEGELQPKGNNLVEGDIPETKTFTGNVGGDKDPGRAAVQGFENINANTAGGLNYSGDDKQGNQFDVLKNERA